MRIPLPKIHKLGLPVAALLVVAVLVVGFTIFTMSPKRGNTITVGWIGPLTGPVSFLGTDNLKAVELAVAEYNTLKKAEEPMVKVVAEDDQYEAQRSFTAYQKIVSTHKAPIIVVNTYSAMGLLADSAARDGVILVNPIDNDVNLARLNANIFLIAKQTEDLAATLANHLMANDKKKIVILYYNGDAFMPTLANQTKDLLQKNQRTVLIHGYPPETTDFQSWLKEGTSNEADAYVLLGYSSLGPAMKQGRALGITAPYYTANLAMAESAGEAIEGTTVIHFTHAEGNSGAAEAFLNRFQQRYRKLPTHEWTAMQPYDATQIVLHALKETQGKKGKFVDLLRSQLRATRDFRGVAGNIQILPDGSSRGIYWQLYRYSKGTLIKIPPP